MKPLRTKEKVTPYCPPIGAFGRSGGSGYLRGNRGAALGAVEAGSPRRLEHRRRCAVAQPVFGNPLPPADVQRRGLDGARRGGAALTAGNAGRMPKSAPRSP